ncbi:MAG: phosphoribosyl-ATP diphosphatase [Polyangia bacterium]|jgi:phosphoribosyl-ATP pyrophosphohydrolase|nr:phosphoribosyl-ATP diphosphatase [Polyangia bacterium]
MIIPALLLSSGRAVVLEADGGDRVLPEPPLGLARVLSRYGELAVLDLDAERGTGDNLELLCQICRKAECRAGGGIKDEARGDALLRAGARSIMVGVDTGEELLSRFPRRKVLVVMDIQAGRVVRKGSQGDSLSDPVELAVRMRGSCGGFVYSLAGNRSSMEPSEMERLEALRSRLPDHSLTVVGGVRRSEDVRSLDHLGVDAQVTFGESAEELDLAECLAAVPDFDKAGGLLPVIVQDAAGQVVALHQTNQEGLIASLRTGQATYWSRVRGGLWIKGEGSGTPQDLLTIRISGNRDALLYAVEQTGAADSRGRYSAFDEMSYNLHRLEQVLRKRLVADDPRRSYSSAMLADREGVRRQILEEARALGASKTLEEVRWETADLIYYLLLNLVQEGLSLDDILRELRGRAGRRRS